MAWCGISGSALGAEIDVGLVHQHHALGTGAQQFLDARQRQADAGGGIRVGDHDARAAFARAIGHGIDVDAQVLVDRQLLAGDAVELRIDAVEAVADVGHQQRLALLEEGEEGVGQHLVGTVAREDLLDREPVAARDGFTQRERGGVGIELEAVLGRLADRLDGARRRGYGFSLVLSFTRSRMRGCSPGT